jgi:hypothetical protein
MNTDDPMDRIEYRHMDRRPERYPVSSTRIVDELPSGYANRSPRTYLGRTGRTSQAA